MFRKIFFPASTPGYISSISLLILRLVFGCMMLTHGWGKLSNFSATAANFEQMGLMGNIGAGLAVFAEVFCALGIIVGFLYRLALIPLIVTMGVAFFGVHGAAVSGPQNGEMALLYLTVFVVLFILGHGKYAVDSFLNFSRNA